MDDEQDNYLVINSELGENQEEISILINQADKDGWSFLSAVTLKTQGGFQNPIVQYIFKRSVD